MKYQNRPFTVLHVKKRCSEKLKNRHGWWVLIDNEKYWRSRAEEARVVAESIQEEQSRQIMLGIADDYERMAQLTAQRLEKKRQQKKD